MKSTKPLEERVSEKQKKLEEMLKKAKQYEAQLKQLEARQKDEERKRRTHRLIEIGAAVESVTESPVEGENLIRFISYLKKLENHDHNLTRNIGLYSEPEDYDENES